MPYGLQPSTSSVVDHLYSVRVAPPSVRRGVRNFHLLYSGFEPTARTERLEAVYEAFEKDVQLRVAELATTRVFVHAGVVAIKGKAVLLPGVSMAGKTTLIAALVRAGATYYSDEYALLDRHGRVHPFLRPLSLRLPDGSRQVQRAEDLGGTNGRRPIEVGAVVMTSYRQNARWRPRVLSPGQGVLAMMANTAPARRQPHQVMATLGKVATKAIFLKGVRGEAEETAERLLARL